MISHCHIPSCAKPPQEELISRAFLYKTSINNTRKQYGKWAERELLGIGNRSAERQNGRFYFLDVSSIQYYHDVICRYLVINFYYSPSKEGNSESFYIQQEEDTARKEEIEELQKHYEVEIEKLKK